REREVESFRTLLGKATPCVGRDRELATIEATLRECIDESVARAVLVTGAPGIGKSRVASEIARRAEGLDVTLLRARADAMRGGATLALFADLIRRAAGVDDRDTLAARRRKIRARVGRHVAASEIPRVAAFLGEIAGAPFDVDEASELAGAREHATTM